MTKSDIEQDAKGQFGSSQADRKSDGVASATPTKVTGHADATVEDQDKKPSPNPGFNIRTQTNNRG